jgi:ATPase family associated with various cellular activities (AAA)
MSGSASWHEANQRYLLAALAAMGEALDRHAARARATHSGAPAEEPDAAPARALEEAAATMPAPPALEVLRERFGLSPFERDVLLLCAGVELDSGFAARCAAAQGDPARRQPTFSLALAALPEPHWSALTPVAPLRCWRLIEVGGGESLTAGPLRIDERVLHFLAGAETADDRLAGLVKPLRETADLVPSQRELAGRIAGAWSDAAGRTALPAVQLCGGEVAGKRAVAVAVAAAVGLQLHVLSAAAVPVAPAELEGLLRLWEREAALSGSALLLDADDLDTGDASREGAVARLVEELRGPLLVAVRERRASRQRPVLAFDVPGPTAEEQRALWYGALGPAAAALNGNVEAVISQFNLGAAAIRSAAAQLGGRADAEAEAAPDPGQLLWDACRAHSRPRLESLAQRLEPAAGWDDLVLPETQREILREISIHVRRRRIVHDDWGFAARSARGLGIGALFAGPSGTGKTMAAEVLARELRLDLYRIDLSSVVSKYIGETEKNLRKVFDAAEEGGAILLFDEADALFGKRSEVKDSHDRYANIEVSYLLQRMEAYRGLAVLTTNFKEALDPAFLRRLRFVVHFPFPDAAQRAEIWRRIFPRETPTDNLDAGKLARLSVAGGNIRNIALAAAFLAANDGTPVRMAHLLRAARGEFVKLERPLSDSEVREWVE